MLMIPTYQVPCTNYRSKHSKQNYLEQPQNRLTRTDLWFLLKIYNYCWALYQKPWGWSGKPSVYHILCGQIIFFFAVCHFLPDSNSSRLLTGKRGDISQASLLWAELCLSKLLQKPFWRKAKTYFLVKVCSAILSNFFNAKISSSSDKTAAATASVFISSAAARLTAPACISSSSSSPVFHGYFVASCFSHD